MTHNAYTHLHDPDPPSDEERTGTMVKISDVFPDLTQRQSEVCALLVKGYSHKEISLELGFGRRVVEDHVQEILRKSKAWDSRRLIYKALGSPEVIA